MRRSALPSAYRRRLQIGLALFAAIGLPWYLARIAEDPQRLRFFVLEQLLGRVDGSEGHPNGFGYLLVRWPLLLLPWTPLALCVLARGAARAGRRAAEPFELFLLLWALLPLVLFSLPATKLASCSISGSTTTSEDTSSRTSSRNAIRRSLSRCGVADLMCSACSTCSSTVVPITLTSRQATSIA